MGTFILVEAHRCYPKAAGSPRSSPIPQISASNGGLSSICRTRRLEKGRCYLKLGRTAAVTAGRCNGALACCNWAGRDKIHHSHNGKGVSLSDNITREFVISSLKPDGANAVQDDLSMPSDSGPLAIDVDKKKACGLLHGSVHGLKGSSAYRGLAMDMPELSNSIILKARSDGVSGAELGLPQ